MKYVAWCFSFLLFFSSCNKGGIGTEEKAGYYDVLAAAPGAGGGGGGGDNPAGVVTAGEWNDLNHWAFWNDLLIKDDFKNFPGAWHFNLANRISVKLIDDANRPITDMPVVLKNRSGNIIWEARTNNEGIAELFPHLSGGSSVGTNDLSIYAGGKFFSGIKEYSEGINELKLPVTYTPTDVADIAFVVDATSSMGDEISYLKTELLNVINRVIALHGNINFRMSSVFYRDEGDEYVIRTSGFTYTTSVTFDFISHQGADGGGDFPEAVHTALKESVQQLDWSPYAKTRILFLILDAPPHDNQDIIDEVNRQVTDAAAKGIRIVPITASGINKSTEFLMRYIAISTNGTYVFITDDSGVGNDHLEPTVGNYEVEYLNDLMVRVINEYVSSEP